MGRREKSAPAFAGTMPTAGRTRLMVKEAYGSLRWKMTVAASGASTEVTMRKAPRLGDCWRGS